MKPLHSLTQNHTQSQASRFDIQAGQGKGKYNFRYRKSGSHKSQYKSIYKTQTLDKRLAKYNVRVKIKGDCTENYLRRQGSLRHLRRSVVCRSRCTRWRRRSRRHWRWKNQRHELGRVLLCLRKELLYFGWASSIRGAHLLPVHLLAMWLGQRDHPLDTLFYKWKLHLKHGIF
jgi:hypothetical protein